MADLVKELKNKALQNRETLNELSAVTEATRLIAQDGADDLNILREMGMAASVEHAQNLHGLKIELEKLEAEYGQIFTLNEIEAVACKYALKFLRSDTYKGKVPPELATKVKQFFKDSGINMNTAKLGFNMYVLAPHKDFTLIDRPKPIAYVDPEPMLFYKLDNTHYRLIHKWGTDLTLWNRIQGIKNSHWTGYWAFWSIKIFLLYGPLLAIAICWFSRLWKVSAYPCWYAIIPSLVAILVGLGRALDTDSSDEMIFKPWKEEWRSDEKPKR